MLRPNCTSDPPFSGGFTIFHTFPVVFRALYGRFGLANRTFPVVFRSCYGQIALATRDFPVVLSKIKRKFYFPHFSARFPGPSRPNWTSDPANSGGFPVVLRPFWTSEPPNSGGFRPEKEKVLFSIFRHFSTPLHGRFALATRQIPVDLRFPHFSGRFSGPPRPNWTSDPANSGGFRSNKKKVLFSTLFRSFSGPLTAKLD